MPTIGEWGNLKFSIYSELNNKHHIPHVHVETDYASGSFSLDGIMLVGDLKGPDLKKARIWIKRHQELLKSTWNERNGGDK